MSTMMTLPEYVEAVQDTLKHWLNIHTNADAWARYWSADDWHCLLEISPKVGNDFFEFDLMKACIYQYAKRYQNDYVKCRRCGLIWKNGYDCDNCNRVPTGKPTIKELAEWLEQCGMSADSFTDDIIERAMEEQGFKAYQEGIRDTIAPVVAEIKDCLKTFKKDWLAGVAWANHVMHVNGNILQDYGDNCGLDYHLVCRVSQESLVGVFGEEAIAEY